MDIEKLTKAQIVLLTLLVSFVTSIATGIVTVTLLDQAPPAFTQTINRVVERTVERVVPDESQQASVVTKEVTRTVVVNEDDLVTESIAKVSQSLVEIVRVTDTEETPVGVGIIMSRDGVVETDSAVIVDNGAYDLVYPDGRTVRARVVDNAAAKPNALLAPLLEEGEAFEPVTPVTLADVSSLKLGQSVIALSGGEKKRIAIGNIVQIDSSENIQTTIDIQSLRKGAPLINIFGEVIGLNTFEGRAVPAFTNAEVLREQLVAFRELESTETDGAQ